MNENDKSKCRAAILINQRKIAILKAEITHYENKLKKYDRHQKSG